MDRGVARLEGDEGTTLIEILMAVMLVGIAFVALLAGFATVQIGSDLHHQLSDADVVLQSAAEAMKSPAIAHTDCATPATYQTAVRNATTVPSGWESTIVVSGVTYWDGVGYTSTCNDTAALGHLLKLQQITLTVTPPGRPGSAESIVVVKADEKVAP